MSSLDFKLARTVRSPISEIKHALSSSDIHLSDGVLKWLISFQCKCSHFQKKTMDYKWVKLSKLGCLETYEMNMLHVSD